MSVNMSLFLGLPLELIVRNFVQDKWRFEVGNAGVSTGQLESGFFPIIYVTF